MSESQQDVAEEEVDAFHSGFSGTNEPLDEPIDESGDAHELEHEEVAPEYMQITRQQFDDLQSRMGEIDHLKTAYAKTSGSIGNMNQILERLQAETPKGESVEFTADDVSDLTDEFGDEMGAAQLKVLQKIAGKLHGTGPAFDPAQFDTRLEETSTSIRSSVKTEILQDMLTDAHPDWVTVRETPEFGTWKESLSESDRNALDTSNSVGYISGRLTEFKDSLKKKEAVSAKGNNRREVMQAAVQPRGDGRHAQTKSATDDFHSGFNKIAGKR